MASTEMLTATLVASNSGKSAVYLKGANSEASQNTAAVERQITAAKEQMLPETVTSKPKEPDSEAVAEAIQSIGDRVAHMARKLEFSINDSSGKVVVTVFDKSSEEIIRQIPGEQAIAIAEHIASLTDDEPILGLLLDSQA